MSHVFTRSVCSLVILGVLAGCPMPPQAIDVTFALDPKQVTVHCALKDLRSEDQDLVLAFRELSGIATPQAAAKTFEHEIFGKAAKYNLSVADKRLDLDGEWVVPRAQFDACASQCGEKTHECEWLPLSICKNSYLLGEKETKGYSYAPGSRTAWPLTSPKIAFSLVRDDKTGFSGTAAFDAYHSDPIAAGALIDWMTATDQAFEAWREPKSVAVTTQAPEKLTAPLEQLARTFLLRKRLALVWAALRDSNVKVEPPAPADRSTVFGGDSKGKPILSKPLAAADSKALKVAYAAATKDPEHAAAAFAVACPKRKTPAKGDTAAICAMLGGL